MKYQILLTTILFILNTINYSQTIVSGNITGTWTPAGNPYIVSGDINVVNSLIITAGVIVKFDGGGWEIRVGENAKMVARGTVNNPVIFEARLNQNPGSWDAIIFEKSGADDTLTYCFMQSAQNAVYIKSGGGFIKTTIRNCTMTNNSENGIRIESNIGEAVANILNSRIYQNFGNGVLVYSINPLYYTSSSDSVNIIGCTIDGNVLSGVRVETSEEWETSSMAALWNCTITRNFLDGVTIVDNTYVGRGYAHATIRNCNLAYNHGYGISKLNDANVGANDVSYNCLWRNLTANFQNISASGFGQNGNYSNANGDSCDINFNIYNNPLFVDTTSQDYRLQLCSKSIDAGTPIIDGQYVLDPDNTYPDIGSKFFNHYNPIIPIFISDSTSFTFGNVPVDSTVSHEFTITNSGQLPLSITEFSASLPSIFTVTPPTAIIEAGYSEQFNVSFTPQVIGNINGSILAHHNARCVPDTFLVSGTGIGPNDVNDLQTPPLEYTLSQNYPNPFNPSTKIKYEIPNTGYVTLKVYDVLGNEITSLVNKEKPGGSYEIEFDGSGLTSGVYFYKITAGSFSETKKMLLMQ